MNQFFIKLRNAARRLEAAENMTARSHAFTSKDEEFLHLNDAIFHASDLADLGDLASSIRKAGLLDDQIDRRGNLLANG
ncbi:MAG: hypothetical protein ABT04_00800 [Granulicella sp. SCN 62-9]|nr:MAG: hypothetical protein ABT04_00800 [Granulicella sp. SCN 62-9]